MNAPIALNLLLTAEGIEAVDATLPEIVRLHNQATADRLLWSLDIDGQEHNIVELAQLATDIIKEANDNGKTYIRAGIPSTMEWLFPDISTSIMMIEPETAQLFREVVAFIKSAGFNTAHGTSNFGLYSLRDVDVEASITSGTVVMVEKVVKARRVKARA